MALHTDHRGRTTRIDTLISICSTAAALSATGAHWDGDVDRWNWNTDTRTTAIALQALIQTDPQNQLLPNVVRYLVSQRTVDAWETTQETAWAVMALTDWMVAERRTETGLQLRRDVQRRTGGAQANRKR